MKYRQQIQKWFTSQGWKPFTFQKIVWQAIQNNESGIIYADTGTGKTYAAWIGALNYCLNHIDDTNKLEDSNFLQILWLTPLRALAVDTQLSLDKILKENNIPWDVAIRTSDTCSKTRMQQNKKLPAAVVTTPESLTLLLTRHNSEKLFGNLKIIIVDEWHQLLGTKRGIQTELALARLRSINANLIIWGLSATLPDYDLAQKILIGNNSQKNAVVVKGQINKKLSIESLLPNYLNRFPTTGHLGLELLPKLVVLLEQVKSSLIYVNTRAHVELWYQALLEIKPDWAGLIAVHHSSLANNVRKWVEEGLRNGKLRCVICTSSMDLGVDFSPVELTVQIGSPKNISRLLQRAGRSGHQPYAVSRLICVPTNALELLDIAAVKQAITENKLETFTLIEKPMDVLIQHIVSMSLGAGFNSDQLFAEIKSTYSYRHLTEKEWMWALNFVCYGGLALTAYPNYHKIKNTDNHYIISNKKIALHHRLTMGTIISESEIPVRYLKGPHIGQVDENFIMRLRPKDCFILSGKMLEFVRVNDNIAYVKKAHKPTLLVPRWQGQRLSLSITLSEYLCKLLSDADNELSESSEIIFLKPLFDVQKKWSLIPSGNRLLIEKTKSREGYHIFFYPLLGRSVHEGLAALCAYRLTQKRSMTISIAANDYGFELLCSTNFDLTENFIYELFKIDNLLDDLTVSINLGELAKRHFKEIAHIAGLIFKGFPKKNKSHKQLLVSSNLLYDVFVKFDPENLLIKQAWQEVLISKFEYNRLIEAIKKISDNPIAIINTSYFSPFAFPLMVDRLRHRLSSESLAERVQRMVDKLEKAVCKI